jgi:hypothetical protein
MDNAQIEMYVRHIYRNNGVELTDAALNEIKQLIPIDAVEPEIFNVVENYIVEHREG